MSTTTTTTTGNVTISQADASLIAIIYDQVYPGSIDLNDAAARMHTIDPKLNAAAVRARFVRLAKKCRSEGLEIGEALKATDKEKTKTKGPKNGVTKAITPKKPRGKAALKSAGKVEDNNEDVEGDGTELDVKDEGKEKV